MRIKTTSTVDGNLPLQTKAKTVHEAVAAKETRTACEVNEHKNPLLTCGSVFFLKSIARYCDLGSAEPVPNQ